MVGLALGPGEYSTPLLAASDVVDVVVTEGRGSWVVRSGYQRFVSLRMPAEVAATVAGAAASDQVRLVLVAGVNQ